MHSFFVKVVLVLGVAILLVEGYYVYQSYDNRSTTVTAPGTTLERTREPAGSTAGKPDNSGVSFVYHATEENSRGDYTYISDPSIDGDANAIVLVSPASGQSGAADQYGAGSAAYEHNIGVWYEPVAREWAIFNQDRAAVPAGATFEVSVPQTSTSFVHRADLLNTAVNYTYIDSSLTNGRPDAVLSVTQNWNPGGGRGVYNNHPVGSLYDAKLKRWAVYNRDGAPIPEGAAFNVAVSAGADKPAR